MIDTAHSLVSLGPNSTQHTSSPRPSCPPLDNPPRVGGATMVRATIARRSPATCIWCEQITPKLGVAEVLLRLAELPNQSWLSARAMPRRRTTRGRKYRNTRPSRISWTMD